MASWSVSEILVMGSRQVEMKCGSWKKLQLGQSSQEEQDTCLTMCGLGWIIYFGEMFQ